MATNFDTFLEQAWADHGDRPEEVAARLEQGYVLIENPTQIAPLARILAHVDGEHLARWKEGVARLERLRTHPQWRDEGDARCIVRRLVAALDSAAGATGPGSPSPPTRARARRRGLGACRAGLMAGGVPPISLRAQPRRHGLPTAIPRFARSPSRRTISRRHSRKSPSRKTDLTAVMLEAAQAAREYWARAGGWLETERAEYMLAKCHLAAGDAKGALAHAEQCSAICEQNGADALEHFFAQATLAVGPPRARRRGTICAGEDGRACPLLARFPRTRRSGATRC